MGWVAEVEMAILSADTNWLNLGLNPPLPFC
jgi:hypothetical protein